MFLQVVCMYVNVKLYTIICNFCDKICDLIDNQVHQGEK